MKRFGLSTIGWCVAAMALSGCVASSEDPEEHVGVAPSALINFNSLDPRALGAAPVYPGGLTPGMLAQGPLDVSSFSSAELSAIQDTGQAGTVSRQLLAYTVGCALDPSQSLSFTWTDSQGAHPETYSGLFGLATGWRTQAPDETAQRWVSACLASRVNYVGTVVYLSSRASAVSTGGGESSYAYREGAFWGNVFTSSPAAYSCDVVANDDHSRSVSRYCAAGYADGSGNLLSCANITRVGSCNDHCQPPTGSADFYPACGGDNTPQVITIYLQ